MKLKSPLAIFLIFHFFVLPIFAAEEMHNIPQVTDINVQENANIAKDHEDRAAKKNKSIGTAMIAAGTAMIAAGSAMTPPNMGLISAGMAMVMMGGQALQTGSNMNSASGASGDIGNLVSDTAGPGTSEGLDGTKLAMRDSTDPKTRENMDKLKGLGYDFDKDGNLNGPHGSMPNVPLNSEKDLVKNGVDPDMASKVMAAANKAALAADEEFSGAGGDGKQKKKVADSEVGEGTNGKSVSGGLDSSGGGGGAFKIPAKKRKLSSEGKVSGKFRKVGGNDRIAVASDNLFFLVKRRYKLKKLQGAFFREKL